MIRVTAKPRNFRFYLRANETIDDALRQHAEETEWSHTSFFGTFVFLSAVPDLSTEDCGPRAATIVLSPLVLGHAFQAVRRR